jgi:DNA-binding response OmpR family regulator
MQHTKGIPWHSYDRTIDVLISRIRNKIKGDGVKEYIKTIHSIGYIFYTEKEK